MTEASATRTWSVWGVLLRKRAIELSSLVSVSVLVLWLLAGPEGFEATYVWGGALLGAIAFAAILGTSRVRMSIRVGILVTALLAAALVSVVTTQAGVAGSTLLAIELLGIGVAGPFLVAAGLGKSGGLTTHTLAATITIYLLIGMTCATSMAIIEAIEDEPTLTYNGEAVDELELREAVYWSYVTLGTLGYGDFSPLTSSARALAVATSIIGQLYLVVAVAAVLGLLVSQRSEDRQLRASAER